MSKTILVIDDNECDQILAQITIQEADPNITILQAYDGEEGLSILQNLSAPPDLILLDLNMPGMDGHEFLEAYDAMNYTTAIVVVLTSSEQKSDKEKCARFDAVKRYMTKPIEAEDIHNIMAEL